jgi:hypothetical protein
MPKTRKTTKPIGRPPKPGKYKDPKDLPRVPREPAFSHIKHRKKRRVLEALIFTGGNMSRACELATITRTMPYLWAGQDETFAEALALARDMAAQVLEDEAFRRAFEGVEEPVGWHQGKPGAYVRRYSDNLLMFTLKGLYPEKYRERLELRGSLANLDLTQLPDDALARLARGEHPLTVLGSLSEDVRRKLLTSGEAEPEPE